MDIEIGLQGVSLRLLFKKTTVFSFLLSWQVWQRSIMQLRHSHFKLGMRGVNVFNCFGKFGHSFQWWIWHFHWPENHANQRQFSLWKENSECFTKMPLSNHIDKREHWQIHIIITVCIVTSQDATNSGSHWMLYPTWLEECQPKVPCHHSMLWLAKSFTQNKKINDLKTRCFSTKNWCCLAYSLRPSE